MKIVIITECTAREMIVVQKVVDEFPDTIIIQPVYPKRRKKLSSLPKRALMKRQYNLLKKKCDVKIQIPKTPKHLLLPSSQLNSQNGVEIIKEQTPDVLITCRAPILCEEIIQAPSIAAVNVHYGIAPKYRGNDSIFWALYHQDFKHLGGCLHYITKGVDTGNILAKVYPALSEADDEASIGIKTSKLLAETLTEYLHIITSLGISVPGEKQKSKGRNYKYSERTLFKSLSLLSLLHFKKIRIPSTPTKIVTFFPTEKNKAPKKSSILAIKNHQNPQKTITKLIGKCHLFIKLYMT